MPAITPFLWFDGHAEEAMKLYTTVFKSSKVLSVTRVQGHVMGVEFELNGQRFMGLNGGPHYKFSEATSFFVGCETQAEINRSWTKLTGAGGEAGRCGWLKDRFGLSWQRADGAQPDARRSRPIDVEAGRRRDDADEQARSRSVEDGARRIRASAVRGAAQCPVPSARA